MFDKNPSIRATSRCSLFISIIVHGVLVVGFWTTPNVLTNRFTGIQVVHAGNVETVVPKVRIAFHLPSAATATAASGASRTSIPPVVSRNAEPAARAESQVAETAIPHDLKGWSDIAIPDEISEQQLQTRFKMPALMKIEPEAVAAPKPPDNEKTLEASDPSLATNGRKVESARLLKQVLPVYPSLARTARVQGRVILDATIDESGKVEDVTVVQGHPMLIAAAIDAIRQWQYEPAKLNEAPTRSSVRIIVVFRLEFAH